MNESIWSLHRPQTTTPGRPFRWSRLISAPSRLYNLPLTKDAYEHLLSKADGIIITKTRYKKPISGTGLVIELDVFSGTYEGLMLAEVEFPNIEAAEQFVPPSWFGEDVTFSGKYQNSRLSQTR